MIVFSFFHSFSYAIFSDSLMRGVENLPLFCLQKEGVMGRKLEADYQSELKEKIENLIPGCTVLKNDANWIQGFPDLSVLYHGKYAVLEVKRSEKEKHRPNQDYYIDEHSKYTCSRFIFPENEEEVLDELQRALGA